MCVMVPRELSFLFPTTFQEYLHITNFPTPFSPAESELATDCPQEKEYRKNFPNIRRKLVAGNMFYLPIQIFASIILLLTLIHGKACVISSYSFSTQQLFSLI